MTPDLNEAKQDWYLSPARDFPNGPHPTTLRYLLCSSPRVGSTLVGQMLRDTEQAGDPLEYLNPRKFRALLRRNPAITTLDAALGFLEQHRTSDNGVFGLQSHWSYFNEFFAGDRTLMDAFFQRFDKVVFMRRRDHIAQGISLYRAARTRLWSSIDEDMGQVRSQDFEEFDPAVITNYVGRVMAQDQGWSDYLDASGRPYLTVYYEDVVAHWDVEGRRLLGFLIERDPPIPPMALRRQRPEQDPLEQKFRRHWGLGG
jgi:LPS sulfotransferase NodH